VVAKVGSAGEMSPAGTRAGVLECARLHADFTAAGKPSRPLGPLVHVYDLDAIPIGGDDLALLLLTDVGATVAVVTITTNAFVVARQASSLRPGLSFPTVSVSGDHLQVAVMSGYNEKNPQILTGRIPLADLK
jgi:hypothetical protein